MSDPYVYPGSEVLKNRQEIRDAGEAQRNERLRVIARHRNLGRAIQSGALVIDVSPEGYRALHRQLFHDVYKWAGEIRTVNIAKQDRFCLAPHIESELAKRFALIRAENELKGLSPAEFAGRAAVHLGELNAIHPFRDGNGRTQRLFLKALAHQAGHALSLTRIEAGAWLKASIESFHGDYSRMRAIIEGAITGRAHALNHPSGDAPPEGGADEQDRAASWKERRDALAAKRPPRHRGGRRH